MIGSARVCGFSRKRRVASWPLITGICTSISTTSNGRRWRSAASTAVTASSPSLACSTCTPHCSSSATPIIMFTGLSSTISTRAPCSALCSSRLAVSPSCSALAAGSGSSVQNSEPQPGVLCTPTLPCISVASSWQIDSPSPVPP